MHRRITLPMAILAVAGLFIASAAIHAQPDKKGGFEKKDDFKKKDGFKKKGFGDMFGKKKAETADVFVSRMLAFDKNKDSKLAKDEVTDTRLHHLFERADADKNGTVSREELEAIHKREGGGDAGFGKGFPFGGPKGKDKGKGPNDKQAPPG